MAKDTEQTASATREVARPNNETELKRGNSGEFVTVGCKLIHGLTLELIDLRLGTEQHPNWNPAPTGPRITLNGANTMMQPGLVVTQAKYLFGRTEVPKEFWDKWLAHNKDNDVVRNGIVFALPHKGGEDSMRRSFLAAAAERENVLTGLEGLDAENPQKDPRMRRTPGGGKETIVTGDPERLASLREQMGGTF